MVNSQAQHQFAGLVGNYRLHGYSLLTRFETYSLPQHAPPPEQILDFYRRKEYRMGQKNMTVELPKGISPFGNSWAIEGDSPLTK